MNGTRAVRILPVKLAIIIAIILTIAAIATLAKSESAAAESKKTELLHIESAWVRPAWGKSGLTAGYATIVNQASTPDRLIAISSAAAKAVELHASDMKDGISRMRRQETFEIQAAGSLLFAPGGNHIMFIGLKEPMIEGGKISVTFTFERAGVLTIDMPVIKH